MNDDELVAQATDVLGTLMTFRAVVHWLLKGISLNQAFDSRSPGVAMAFNLGAIPEDVFDPGPLEELRDVADTVVSAHDKVKEPLVDSIRHYTNIAASYGAIVNAINETGWPPSRQSLYDFVDHLVQFTLSFDREILAFGSKELAQERLSQMIELALTMPFQMAAMSELSDILGVEVDFDDDE